MATELFTKDEFETRALPLHRTTKEKLWKELGIVQGEYAYSIQIDSKTNIHIRSSIGSSGVCASNGDDSIRAWLTDSEGNPLGSKVSKYTTRISGWDARTKNVLRTLWGWRIKAGDCPMCGKPKKIFKVKKEGPNKGRVFAQCDEHKGFTWL
jgi:hypothetical protein